MPSNTPLAMVTLGEDGSGRSVCANNCIALKELVSRNDIIFLMALD
jgi:hypothetical protein